MARPQNIRIICNRGKGTDPKAWVMSSMTTQRVCPCGHVYKKASWSTRSWSTKDVCGHIANWPGGNMPRARAHSDNRSLARIATIFQRVFRLVSGRPLHTTPWGSFLGSIVKSPWSKASPPARQHLIYEIRDMLHVLSIHERKHLVLHQIAVRRGGGGFVHHSPDLGGCNCAENKWLGGITPTGDLLDLGIRYT